MILLDYIELPNVFTLRSKNKYTSIKRAWAQKWDRSNMATEDPSVSDQL